MAPTTQTPRPHRLTATTAEARELAAWNAATDAHALAPTRDPETLSISRTAGDAIDATHNQPGGYYSPAAYEARAAIWHKLARDLMARRYAVQVEPARAAKARADEAVRDCYAAGRTPSTLARSCYAAGREYLAYAEQDARDASGAYSAQDRQRAAANLPRHAEAAIIQFGETVSNL